MLLGPYPLSVVSTNRPSNSTYTLSPRYSLFKILSLLSTHPLDDLAEADAD